jgi:hypothetical protein
VPDKKQFQMIAVGDQIQVTYTEALRGLGRAGGEE